jgi:hypothetical protein
MQDIACRRWPAWAAPGRSLARRGYKLYPYVEAVQEKAVSFGMAMMFPTDDAELAEHNRKLSEGVIDL